MYGDSNACVFLISAMRLIALFHVVFMSYLTSILRRLALSYLTRAVEYAMQSNEIPSLCYHGDLNSKEREDNLQKFRDGEVTYLVCTDIAARGLDIPDVRTYKWLRFLLTDEKCSSTDLTWLLLFDDICLSMSVF